MFFKQNQTTMSKTRLQMYSLDCDYYHKEFNSLDKLLDDIVISGMDPNYKITKDGRSIGETAWELIEPYI